jgi:molybdopterin-guanine dinucleotide biosynthesis protein
MSHLDNLPPDPEGKNDDRAGYAGTALSAFATATGMVAANEEPETILHDLLCDLMHWCDRNGVSFDAKIADAATTYFEETRAD